MSARVTQWAVATTLVVSLVGCKALLKKREPVTTDASASAAAAPPPAPASALPPSPPPTPAAVASAEADSAVPTSQDFEDEAFEKVTSANFKAEFQKLKQAIEKK